jgi:hypothetical protein
LPCSSAKCRKSSWSYGFIFIKGERRNTNPGGNAWILNELKFNGRDQQETYIGVRRISAINSKLVGEKPMKKLKMLTAVTILSTAVVTPVLAKDARYHNHAFRGAYNQMTEPSFAVPQTRAERNIQNFGFSGRDPSRVGGWDPDLNPPS